MEFWLTFSGSDRLRLPVPPSSFEINRGNMNQTVNIQDFGELNVLGKEKLATILISSFFPNDRYDFCQYTGFPAPYECVRRIERWRKSGKPIKLTITATDIDLPVSIENFKYGEKEEGTGDVYFSLELKEYKHITLDTKQTADAQERPVTKEIPQKYTVKAGDTLWMIAQKQYGDGSRYPSLAAKNGIKDPNLIYPGQVLTL